MSLIIKDISYKKSDCFIIKNINIEAKKGELTIIIGKNGAGKTTLLKTIVGIQKKTAGEIYLQDKEASIAYMPQNTMHQITCSVLTFVVMGVTPYLKWYEAPKRKDYEEAKKYLDFVGMIGKQNSPMNQLSGGERQLVYLARTLLQQADVFILDEPSAHLDYEKQHIFLDKLKQFIKEQHIACLCVFHDPNLALAYADKIVVMDKGEVVTTIEVANTTKEECLEKLNKVYKRLDITEHHGKYVLTWN